MVKWTNLPVLLLLMCIRLAWGQEATFTGLGDLPGGSSASVLGGISPNGLVVVGQSSSENGPEAFRWEDDVMVGLGDLPGSFFGSAGFATSADGSVVVGFGESDNGTEAFRWEAGVTVGLGDIPGGDFDSEANDVSYDGSVVVGHGEPASGTPPSGAFRWEAGVMEALPDLPGGEERGGAYAVSSNGSIVAGWGIGPGDTLQAVRWVDGVVEGLGFPPGGTSTFAYDMSADGSVIVGPVHVTNPNGTEAFIWREGVGMDYVPDLPGGSPYREAFAVSGDGQVVVGIADGANGIEVFIWEDQIGMRSLRELLEDDYGLDLGGWALWAVYTNALSYDGRVIVGSGFNPQGDSEAWRAELPPWPVANAPDAPQSSELTVSVFPNPVRERATIRVTLSAAGHVRIDVLDVLGRVVAVPHDGVLAIGAHSFSLSTERLPAGVYIVRSEIASGAAQTVARTLTILR